jgi:hypothetical protein
MLCVEVGPCPATAKSLIARVVHTKALREGQWLVGCAFLSRLGAEKLQAVLFCTRPEPTGQGPETIPPLKCLSARIAVEGFSSLTPRTKSGSTCCILRELLLEGAPTVAGRPSLLVRQVHLRGPWPLPEGATLLVRLNDLPGEPAGTRLKVKDCCQRGPLWVIRYEFEGAPPAEVLRKFGQGCPDGGGASSRQNRGF